MRVDYLWVGEWGLEAAVLKRGEAGVDGSIKVDSNVKADKEATRLKLLPGEISNM